MVLGQRHEGFPHRDGHGEIQDISNDWIALGTWRVRENRFLPSPCEDGDGDGKQQQIDDYRRVKHGEMREVLYPDVVKTYYTPVKYSRRARFVHDISFLVAGNSRWSTGRPPNLQYI